MVLVARHGGELWEPLACFHRRVGRKEALTIPSSCCSQFVTGCYCALSLATFANIYRVEQEEESLEQVLCITAASFFGSALVFIYALVSFFVILR